MNKANFSEAEAFLAVVDRGGFGAAARELGITQSTVSRRIAALETRIGKRLVERTTRRVALTEAGLAFANDLRDVLARLADAEGRVQSEGSEPEGLLRVTMPTAYGRTSVLPRLAALARRYPRLRFELDLSDRYVDILEEGYDLDRCMSAPHPNMWRSTRRSNGPRISPLMPASCSGPTRPEASGDSNGRAT